MYRLAPVVAAAICFIGCRTLPSVVYVPDDSADELVVARQQCAWSLNQRRAEIGRLGTLQDVMVLLGGAVSAGGGVTAAVFAGNSTGTNDSKTPAIVSASIAAGSGLVAIASKLVEDPSIQANRHTLKRQHYDAGLSVLRQQSTATGVITGEARNYVIARFGSCAKDLPEPEVPPLPAGNQTIQ